MIEWIKDTSVIWIQNMDSIDLQTEVKNKIKNNTNFKRKKEANNE